jgi:hypothetical protein
MAWAVGLTVIISAFGCIYFGVLILLTAIGYNCDDAENMSKPKAITAALVAILAGLFLYTSRNEISEWGTSFDSNVRWSKNEQWGEEVTHWMSTGATLSVMSLIIFTVLGVWLIYSILRPLRGGFWGHAECTREKGSTFAEIADGIDAGQWVFFGIVAVLFFGAGFSFYQYRKFKSEHTAAASGIGEGVTGLTNALQGPGQQGGPQVDGSQSSVHSQTSVSSQHHSASPTELEHSLEEAATRALSR